LSNCSIRRCAANPLPLAAELYGRRAEKMGATRDVGEGFIDGDSFDERREIIKHVDGRIAEPFGTP
jgi:hypothetical protein